MSTIVCVTLLLTLILSILLPFGSFLIGERNRGRYKTSLAVNCFFFFGTLLLAMIIAFTGNGSVAAAADAAANKASNLSTGMGYLAAAFVTGLSCIGGGIAVASAASAALGAISEDQSVLGKSLIFVGLSEGIALYGLIISFMILGQLG